MFITFEGIEGSGKTTQIKLLAEHLEKSDRQVTLTREPGGTPIGDQIRQILLDSKNNEMVHACEVLLYYAARAQHMQQKVWPQLENGHVVLCDRFVDATVAYQGYARGVDLKVLQELNNYVLQGFHAQLSLLFDMPVETGLGRAKKRAASLAQADKEDRFENEMLDFHKKVRQGYLDIAKKEPERFVVVDATLGIEELHQKIVKIVDSKLAD